jgi:uncharacterized membrane protein YbhN (UPF0104 family)
MHFYRRLASGVSGWSAFRTDFYIGLRQFQQRGVVLPVLVSVLTFSCLVWQNNFLAQALQLSLPFTYLAFCLAAINLIALLPISISGLGTRDAVFILLLGKIGISPERALGLSLLFLVTFNLAGVVVGMLAWYLRPILGKSSDNNMSKSLRSHPDE